MARSEKTISFRALTERIETLDSLAAAQDRSRSYLINEALSNYIELHAYQDTLVRRGLEQMQRGRVVNHEEVLRRLTESGRASRLTKQQSSQSSGRSSRRPAPQSSPRSSTRISSRTSSR